MPFVCFHLLSTYARNNDGSNPETREKGCRVRCPQRSKSKNSSCAETAHATTRRDFKLWLEILGIRRCALRVGWYWSARERLLQLFADAINVRPPSSLAAI